MQCRLLGWKKKTDGAKITATPVSLGSLTPTDEALELNIMRSHYQAMMWNNCIDGQPQKVDPCEVSLICTGNASYNVRIEVQPLFCFFRTKIKRPFFSLHFLVWLGEGQLHKYNETYHVA